MLDVCDVNRLLGFDRESQIVEVESGMFGDIFEQTIQQEYGMTMGHWPSSYAISTVGGWVACRDFEPLPMYEGDTVPIGELPRVAAAAAALVAAASDVGDSGANRPACRRYAELARPLA